MCGRFNIHDDPLTRALMDALGVPAALPEMINVAPTEGIPTVFEEDGERRMRLMRWWLVPHWAPEISTRYSMFNARSETLASSRAFKGPLRYRRCIVPASSFIEWTTTAGTKQPWLIREPDAALAFAGLWDTWEKGGNYLESCTIVTTAAAPQFSHIHSRMPVMLHGADIDRWLDVSIPPATLDDLYLPRLSARLELLPLGREVGNSRHKSAEVLTPIGDLEIIDPTSG